MTAKNQRGVTIIELMIGLALGTFLLAGVLQIYVSSSQAYRTNEALSRVQESGRFALDFIMPELRQAGFKGSCTGPVNNLLNEAGAGYSADLFDIDTGIFGWNDASGPHTLVGYRAGTDVVLIKHASVNLGVTASGNTPINANNINLTGASGVPAGTIVVVADAEGCDVFQSRSNANANNLSRGASNSNPGPGNKNPGSFNFSKAYQNDMEILGLRSVIFYVGTGTGGSTSLRRVRFDRGTLADAIDEELVEGVIDMQICYGVDTNDDREADTFVNAGGVAANQWPSVVAARVTIVAVSPQENVSTGGQTLSFSDCDGTVLTRDQSNYPELGQRRLAQVFTSTVGLRNRLP